MGRVSDDRLKTWVNQVFADEECLQEVRDRMAMKMMQRFRTGDAEKREIINYIMDNEVIFFDELKSIAASFDPVNDEPEENTETDQPNQ